MDTSTDRDLLRKAYRELETLWQYAEAGQLRGPDEELMEEIKQALSSPSAMVRDDLFSLSKREDTPEEKQAKELMALEIEKLKAQGYVRKDSTPKDVASAWHWHCRQQSLPYIQISFRPIQSSRVSGPFAILLITDFLETVKPVRRTSSRMAKLRKDWTERIGRGIDSDMLNAREGSLFGLTEEQAISLAHDLWAILGQSGAYEQAEPEDDPEEEW